MTRRHDSLLPLTHDHHHALRNARMLRLAADGEVAARIEAAEAFLQFFRSESVTHFREEEEIIFPLVALHEDAPTAGIHRVLSEHVVMHALVRELDAQVMAGEPSGRAMLALAELLKAHVRFEEDELFPAIESLVPGELSEVSLARRSRAHAARDREASRSMTADERLDETVVESFPASDPPPYWPGVLRNAPPPQTLDGK